MFLSVEETYKCLKNTSKMQLIKQTLLICSLLGFLSLPAQNREKKQLKYGAQYKGKREDAAMQKWRSNRFGQFIHWGLYAIPGGEWKGKTYPYAAEFLKSSAHISNATWDSLSYKFNPVKFDPKAWAKMAKNMGVKYMTITTKHHEGFSLWPSKYSEFNVANTPYKKDIIGALVKAYNSEGIDVNFYYSVLDWHHPDWRYDIQSKEDSIAFSRYLNFAQNQLRELAENYPTVKGFWFDGTWDKSIKKNGWWTLKIEKMLKEIRPGVVVNSRLRADDFGSRHFDSNGDMMGDYESGYERRLPSPTDTQVIHRDWEACMTIPENQWGYHKKWDISYTKTPFELIEMLAQTTSLGGNFLLNFGPQADGMIRTEEQQIAETIGNWMKINHPAIYNGGYAKGWQRQDWGYFTQNEKDKKLYAIVFNIPISGILKIQTPEGVSIGKASLLENTNSKITIKEIAKRQINLYLPKQSFPAPFVIVLDTANENKNNYIDAKT